MKNTKNTTGKKIPVCDLKREAPSVRREAEKAIKRVIERGRYILGKELESLEKEFASYCASSRAVGVSSGTDAIRLSLEALSIGRGDEVITAVNTAIPTAMAIAASGARPRFVDVREDTFNMDASGLEGAITKKTKAVIPVHLYGNPCEMEGILKIAGRHKLFVIEDACQAHGASYKGRRAGTFGALGAFSFYPTKNLGCYGDGGMVITNSRKLAGKIKRLRNYGQRTRYKCETHGINSRLDEIQAAALRVKLKHLEGFNAGRIRIAGLYGKYLSGIEEITLPSRAKGAKHVFHLYVIKCKGARRGLRQYLAKKGIETEMHYPVPLHLQEAFKGLGYGKGDFPRAEKLAKQILSLPIFPGLEKREVRRICDTIKDFYRKHANTR